MRFLIWIGILIFFLPAIVVPQQDTLILLGTNTNMGGYAISTSHNYAFVPAFDSIKVADYSGPPNLPQVTSYPVSWSGDIAIRDGLAYYVGDSLYIIDIKDPLEPKPIGTCPLGSNWAFRVHLFDSLALVMHSTPPEICLLRIIDISDPADPQIISTPEAPPYGSMYPKMDAWKKNNYVYWVDEAILYDEEPWVYLGRIIVVDITDPTNPVPIVIDTCLPSPPSAIWIKGNYAYVALTNISGAHGGLMMLDISDPYNIDSAGFFETPYTVNNVYIERNLAYISGLGLYVLDITDPTSPTLVTYYQTPYACMDVSVDEPYVLVAQQSSLLLFEASFLIAGDVNGNREVNISDVIYLINYLFLKGPAPLNPDLADVNSDCQIDIADIIWLMNYLFRNGPDPQIGCVS